MLAGALCRLAADAPRASPHDMPLLARSLRRALLARNAARGPQVRALSRAFASALDARRSYATTTTTRAPKPTPTVKKAVKTAVARKPAPKKTAATAKKAAPKKKPAARKAPKKTAKKPAAKKAVPKRRVKKTLTPEEQQKAKIRELRLKALKEPVSFNNMTALNAFIAEKLSGAGAGAAPNRIGAAHTDFKKLTSAELEHYNHIANEKNAARRVEYQAWLNTYTPDQIRIANNARSQLRKLLAGTQKRTPAYTAKLVDDRQPKRQPKYYAVFVKERFNSGDFKNIAPTEAMKLISQEWKALSAGEKKKFQDDAPLKA